MPRACAAASASATAIAIRSDLAEAHALPWNQRVNALALHKLHHDEVAAVGRLDLVNGDDVRMVERGCGLRFLHEAPTAALVCDSFSGEHLDGDVTIQSRVARTIHLTHAARANQREHFIRAELGPGG